MTLVKRGQVLSQPPHFRIGQSPRAPVDQAIKDARRALMYAKQDRGEPRSTRDPRATAAPSSISTGKTRASASN